MKWSHCIEKDNASFSRIVGCRTIAYGFQCGWVSRKTVLDVIVNYPERVQLVRWGHF